MYCCVSGETNPRVFLILPLKIHALSSRPRRSRTRCQGRCCRRRLAPCRCHDSRQRAEHRPSGTKQRGTGHTKEGRPSVPEIPKTAPKYVWTSLNHHMKKRKVQNLPPPNLLKDVNTMLAPCMPCMCAMCVYVVYLRAKIQNYFEKHPPASTLPVKKSTKPGQEVNPFSTEITCKNRSFSLCMFYIIREYPTNYQSFIVASNRDG